MSKKVQDLKTNNISSKQIYKNLGYLFHGNIRRGNELENGDSSILPPNSYFGTSELNGNIVQDFYNLYSNEPISYLPTDDDKKQITERFKEYLIQNAVLSVYPYLNPFVGLSNFNEKTINERIYKHLGKGLGKVSMFKVASSFIGQENSAGTTTEILNNGITSGTIPKSNGLIYPFNGYIYSGTIVQLVNELDQDTGIYETKIIPYQIGRGIPLYSSKYLPENSTELTPFGPYGELTWDSGNTMSPSLATGIIPGENNVCIGIVLDSETTESNRPFKIQVPTGFDEETLEEDPHQKYYEKPAPQTSLAASVITNTEQGYFSPGPNLSSTYYAPWPRYYAYETNEPIPVLTEGITTAKIGAAYNIALMNFGVRQQISSTDEQWLPVTCIPLFQGERIEAGSTIYASVKGHIFTPGPYVDQVVIDDADNLQNQVQSTGSLGQTPWDPFIDSTWGNIGWSGTPGLSFGNIPDTSTSILEIAENSQGNRQTISGLSQANQGTIIVQGVTTNNPSPSIGNAYLQNYRDTTLQSITESQVLEIKQLRSQIPGISGRCTLSQSVPEKAQPIGIILETIEGKGKWTYTGLSQTTSDFIGSIVTGGVVYPSPSEAGNTPLRTNTGGGSGGSGAWTTNLPDEPFLGTITGTLTFPVLGAGYSDGDILTLQDDSLNYISGEIRYRGNNTAVVVGDGGTTLTLQLGGSGYVADTEYEAHNLSLNNIYIEAANVPPTVVNVLNDPDNYYFDEKKYPPGTVFRTLRKGFAYYNAAYFTVDNLSNNTINVSFDISSSPSFPPNLNYYETDQSNFFTLNGRPIIKPLTVGSDGEILTYEILNYGCGNQEGDRIVVINSLRGVGLEDFNNNCVISFPGVPAGDQEIVSTGPNYIGFPNGVQNQIRDTNGNIIVGALVQFDIPDPFYNNPESDLYLIIVGLTNSGLLTPGQLYIAVNYNTPGTEFANPRYHGNFFTFFFTSLVNTSPHRGGTNYTGTDFGTEIRAINLDTYNISSNMYRGYFTITNGIITGQAVFSYLTDTYNIDPSRYTFDADNGTEFRILFENTPEEFSEIRRLVSYDENTGTIVTSQVKSGGLYDLPDGDYIFETQRLDHTNPKVDAIIDSNGYIRRVILRDKGSGNQNGDFMLVLQEGSNNNCIFLFNDNMPIIDLPPYANVPYYKVEDDNDAWVKYSDVMASAENLFDKQVLIELRKYDENTMENIYPTGAIGSNRAPPTNNMYRELY